jgi:elongation factor Ts
MAEITAAQVKELRGKTSAGMMDCKKALSESGGDIEAAIDWLRTKGLAAAAKRAGRVAAEGLVAAALSDGAGAVVEVNAETDFVARNEVFQNLVQAIVGVALEGDGDVERILAAEYPGGGHSVSDEIIRSVATIGENIGLRRAARLAVESGVVASYVHAAVAPGMGRIGVLVALSSEADKARLEALGKQLAMHIAASSPTAVAIGDLDPALVERERTVLTEQARDSGRPDEIIAKMVEGRLGKFYQGVVLMEQTFAIDGESRVAEVIAAAAEEAGGAIEVTGFVRFALGEGIER